MDYLNGNISLVSGLVNFDYQGRNIAQLNKRKSATMSYNSDISPPIITEAGEYSVFHIEDKINLESKSQFRHAFVSTNQISYKSIYHIDHSIQYYRGNTESNNQNIPVYVRLELNTVDIAPFQLPGGIYKVYEKKDGNFTYIGTGSAGIVSENDIIKLEIGKTHDILCTFTLKSYELERDIGKAEINAVFENRKGIPVEIIWMEKFSDGRWKIIKSNSEYERLDAYNAKFNISIPENSKKEINFIARIEKM